MNRRTVFATIAALAVTISLGAAASAADKAPFDDAAFQAAQTAGKPILLHITAPWCPTCKAQTPIIARLTGESRFAGLVSFNIDFDTQKDLLKKFGVRMQSTLIVFKGAHETGRSTGDTNPASLEALLAKAI